MAFEYCDFCIDIVAESFAFSEESEQDCGDERAAFWLQSRGGGAEG